MQNPIRQLFLVFIRIHPDKHTDASATLDTANREFCLCQSIISSDHEARYHTVHILPRISSYFNEPETQTHLEY